jgi:hypothetical protein
VIGNPVVAVQVGHAIRTAELVDGGSPGQLRPGDAFVVRFVQPVDVATGPTAANDICVHATSDDLLIGRVESRSGRACSTNHATIVGRIDGLGLAPNGETSAYAATYAWSDCVDDGECTTLTATVGDRTRGGDVDATVGTSTVLLPSTRSGVLRAVDGTALCTAANTTARHCQPTVSGGL